MGKAAACWPAASVGVKDEEARQYCTLLGITRATVKDGRKDVRRVWKANGIVQRWLGNSWS